INPLHKDRKIKRDALREARTVSYKPQAIVEVNNGPCFFTTSTKEFCMSQTLLEMAKDLVLAQIEAHRLSPEEMHQALQQTYASLQALKAQEDTDGIVAVTTPTIPPKPVDWRKSLTKYAVTCLECGQSYKQLSVRHLKEHGLDGRSYREKYSIPRAQPLAAKATTVKRKEIVQRSRPWEKAPTFLKAHGKAQQAGAHRKSKKKKA